MKNLILSTAILLSSLSIPSTANAVTIENDDQIELAKCSINERIGNSIFSASGNCNKVMKAYKEWRSMQPQQ